MCVVDDAEAFSMFLILNVGSIFSITRGKGIDSAEERKY